MWTKAKVRDWKRAEYLPMKQNDRQEWINFDRGMVLETNQPDKLDGAEFNLVVKLPKTTMTVLMRSIDFDFVGE